MIWWPNDELSQKAQEKSLKPKSTKNQNGKVLKGELINQLLNLGGKATSLSEVNGELDWERYKGRNLT